MYETERLMMTPHSQKPALGTNDTGADKKSWIRPEITVLAEALTDAENLGGFGGDGGASTS